MKALVKISYPAMDAPITSFITNAINVALRTKLTGSPKDRHDNAVVTSVSCHVANTHVVVEVLLFGVSMTFQQQEQITSLLGDTLQIALRHLDRQLDAVVTVNPASKHMTCAISKRSVQTVAQFAELGCK